MSKKGAGAYNGAERRLVKLDNKFSVNDCRPLRMNPVGKPFRGNGVPRELALAMAYVPWQKWDGVYTPDVALTRGTMFSELDLPFLGEEVI